MDCELPGLRTSPSHLHLGPLVAMYCTVKLSIVFEDVVECTHSINIDIECVHSIK